MARGDGFAPLPQHDYPLNWDASRTFGSNRRSLTYFKTALMIFAVSMVVCMLIFGVKSQHKRSFILAVTGVDYDQNGGKDIDYFGLPFKDDVVPVHQARNAHPKHDFGDDQYVGTEHILPDGSIEDKNEESVEVSPHHHPRHPHPDTNNNQIHNNVQVVAATVAAGKETSGKETGKEQAGKEGKETGKEGKETGKEGKETGKETGKEGKETGKETAAAAAAAGGKEETGKATATAGKETGKEAPTTGKEAPAAGKPAGKA